MSAAKRVCKVFEEEEWAGPFTLRCAPENGGVTQLTFDSSARSIDTTSIEENIFKATGLRVRTRASFKSDSITGVPQTQLQVRVNENEPIYRNTPFSKIVMLVGWAVALLIITLHFLPAPSGESDGGADAQQSDGKPWFTV